MQRSMLTTCDSFCQDRTHIITNIAFLYELKELD